MLFTQDELPVPVDGRHTWGALLACGPSGPRAQRAPTRSGGSAKPTQAKPAARVEQQTGRGGPTPAGGDHSLYQASRQLTDMKVSLGLNLIELRGKVGFFVGKRLRSLNQLTKKSIPYSISGTGPSEKQVAVRTKYTSAIEFWHSLTPEEQAVYNAAGESLGISGFNYILAHMSTPQTSVDGDTTESATFDTEIVTLVNNLNRIRAAIAGITGGVWSETDVTLASLNENKITESPTESYEPEVTWSNGTPTFISQSYRYKIIGDLVHLQIFVSASSGNGVTGFSIPLPVAAKQVSHHRAGCAALHLSGTTVRVMFPYIDLTTPDSTLHATNTENFVTVPTGTSLKIMMDVFYERA